MKGYRLIKDLTKTFNLEFKHFANNDIITHYVCEDFKHSLYICCWTHRCLVNYSNYWLRFYYKSKLNKAQLKQFIAELLYYARN